MRFLLNYSLLILGWFFNFPAIATLTFEDLPNEVITKVISYIEEDASTLKLVNRRMCLVTEEYLKYTYVAESSRELIFKSKNPSDLLKDILFYLRRKQECRTYHERAFIKHEMTALYDKDHAKVVTSALKYLKYWPRIDKNMTRRSQVICKRVFSKGIDHCQEIDKLSKVKLHILFGKTRRPGYLDTGKQDLAKMSDNLEAQWFGWKEGLLFQNEQTKDFLNTIIQMEEEREEVNLLSLKARFNRSKFYEEGSQGYEKNLSEAFKGYEKTAEEQEYLKCGDCKKREASIDSRKIITYTPKEQVVRVRCKKCKKGAYGYAPSQCALARMYREGKGAYENPDIVFRNAQKAALQGLAEAQNLVGFFYYQGYGIKKDYKEAATWYLLSASKSNSDAQLSIGWLYEHGYGIDKDYNKAMEWYSKAASQGHLAAYVNIGNLYRDGHGVLRDYKKAREWYSKAVEKGEDMDVYVKTGDLYRQGGYGIGKDYKRAIELYLKAAEQGDVDAQVKVGDLFRDGGYGIGKDHRRAMGYYLLATKQKNITAYLGIGDLYRNGYSDKEDYRESIHSLENNYNKFDDGELTYNEKSYTKPTNFNKALEWYSKASDQLDHDTCIWIGDQYSNGYDVEKDYKKAQKWYNKGEAVERGHARAQFSLAQVYENEMKDLDVAIEWYTKAALQDDLESAAALERLAQTGNEKARQALIQVAERGHARAQLFLARVYEKVMKDLDVAIEWYTKAALQDDWQSAAALERLAQVGNEKATNAISAVNWRVKMVE